MGVMLSWVSRCDYSVSKHRMDVCIVALLKRGELFKVHRTISIVIHTCYYGNGHMNFKEFTLGHGI